MALVVFPLVETTTTSPGRATSRALWTMRLSPGRAFTVTATPQRGRRVRLTIPGSMKWKRPMASATLEDAFPRKASTRSAGGRGTSVMIRKPSFGGMMTSTPSGWGRGRWLGWRHPASGGPADRIEAKTPQARVFTAARSVAQIFCEAVRVPLQLLS